MLLAGIAGAATGCRAITRSPYDQIEAELRTRERELSEARAELQNARHLNDAYARTPRGLAEDGGAAPFQPLKEIVLGSGTGGADNDGQPGDEALQVVLVPRDGDVSAVKVPATVTVLAFEVAKNGTKAAIGRWDVSPDVLRKTWRSGLFATGYYMQMQWDRLPANDKVRIQVRMETLDGRVFEADRDITVRVLPNGIREICPPAVPPAWVPPPVVPAVPTVRSEVEALPPPKEVRSNRPASIAPARQN